MSVAAYQLRLYKRGETPKNLRHLVQQVDIEADSDSEAIRKAGADPVIPRFDNSDLAMLFSGDGRMVHEWHA